jgi:hypothetical protein
LAFDCKDTSAKGFVIAIAKEKGNRRTKKEYEEFTRHLDHDSIVYAILFRPPHVRMIHRGPLAAKFKVARYQ